MARDRNRRRFLPEAPFLERRELLARPATVHAAAPGVGVFNQAGISTSVLHKAFTDQLNRRLSISASQAHLVFEAFQVFQQDYAALPPASAGRGAALDTLLGQLDTHLGDALTRYELTTTKVGPSVIRSPKFSPQEQQALVPLAQEQVQALGVALAAGPANPTPALNVAYNAIMNALAEYSVHPTLFRKPSDFYLNPRANFTTSFDATPASGAPGVFLLGPGGVPLPGAPRRA